MDEKPSKREYRFQIQDCTEQGKIHIVQTKIHKTDNADDARTYCRVSCEETYTYHRGGNDQRFDTGIPERCMVQQPIEWTDGKEAVEREGRQDERQWNQH